MYPITVIVWYLEAVSEEPAHDEHLLIQDGWFLWHWRP